VVKHGPVIYASTEEYNGTSWTNTTNMTTARQDLAGMVLELQL
jgi:hypothetical protein